MLVVAVVKAVVVIVVLVKVAAVYDFGDLKPLYIVLLRAHLHYDENAAFCVRLAGFMNLIFFIREQMANTNTKTLRFRRNVNEP